MNKRAWLGGLTALALLPAAQAAPVTFGFTGSVVSVALDDLGTGIGFGTAFSGEYTFDSAAADAIAGATQGSYTSVGAPYGMAVTIGGNNFAAAGFLNVGISNNLPQDQYLVLASDGGYDLSLFLEDLDGSVFASDALPATPPNLADFEIRGFRLVDIGGGMLELDGQIDSLSCIAGCGGSTVPEPGSLALVLAGLAAGAVGRRRQS